MATKTFEELKQMAIQIRDEKANKQNTATRIGTQMIEHLNKLEQEYYNKENIEEQNKQTDAKFSELSNNTNQQGDLLNSSIFSSNFQTDTEGRKAYDFYLKEGLEYTFTNNTLKSVNIVLADNLSLENKYEVGTISSGNSMTVTPEKDYNIISIYYSDTSGNVTVYCNNFLSKKINEQQEKNNVKFLEQGDLLNSSIFSSNFQTDTEGRNDFDFYLKEGLEYTFTNNSLKSVEILLADYKDADGSYIGRYDVGTISSGNSMTVTPDKSYKLISIYFSDTSGGNVKVYCNSRLGDKIAELEEETVRQSDIDIQITSNNLADPSGILKGTLVNNSGQVTPSPDWDTYRLDVTDFENITFGNFRLNRNGYYAFYSLENVLLETGDFADPIGTPVTVTKPSGAKYLYFDIKSNGSTESDYVNLTISKGDTLLPYDKFEKSVMSILGATIKGSEVGDIGGYIADLPVSDGSNIESGFAYIDSTTRVIKVK